MNNTNERLKKLSKRSKIIIAVSVILTIVLVIVLSCTLPKAVRLSKYKNALTKDNAWIDAQIKETNYYSKFEQYYIGSYSVSNIREHEYYAYAVLIADMTVTLKSGFTEKIMSNTELSLYGSNLSTSVTKYLKNNFGLDYYFGVGLNLTFISDENRFQSTHFYLEYSSSSSSSSSSAKIDAWVCAQKAVTDKLKAPSTAKFPPYNSSYVTSLGDNKYRIKAYVDSQNGFGAMVRTNFTVTLTLTGTGFKDSTVVFN